MCMTPRVLLVAAIAAAGALLSGACSGESDDRRPRSSEAQTTAAGTNSAAEPADKVVDDTTADIDIGGRSLFLRCWGTPVAGWPTILLLSGSDLDTTSWARMAPELAADDHHVCSYDRLGAGLSDPPLEPRRTTEDQVDDAVALLDAAGLPEPVVLVAHSLGSLPAVELVDRVPQRIAGVVFVDPWSPRVSTAQRAALPPEGPDESAEIADERRFLNEYLYDPAQNREHLLLAKNDELAAELFDRPGPAFGDLPVVVLQAPPLGYLPGLPMTYHEATLAAIEDGAAEFAAESTQGTLIKVEDTGHNIQDDQPQAVINAILDVLTR